jgi:hypothetical protein
MKLLLQLCAAGLAICAEASAAPCTTIEFETVKSLSI